ncbi:GtrA family protein [Paracoccus subflavus]|jgi:putative flippase GtrA|uniref:GtrA family protein n=1 Tax=Paracoccus subflavus TaxID=2528244 RepID=A0A4Q9G0Q5_9RHOB|nr:GtrA family protein [Paracoccus subflavus]
MLGAAARFALTGGVATLVHLIVAITLIRLGVAALAANAAAFMTAFLVSFWGHHLFTFAGHGVVATRAFQRFVVVAAIGFLVNETLLLLLLMSGASRPEVTVLISTAFAAASTFILSRHWAFAGTGRGR